MTEAASSSAGPHATAFAAAKARCWEIARRHYPAYVSPDEHYGAAIERAIRTDHPLLDAGCGPRMSYARRFAPRTGGAIAVDLVRNREVPAAAERVIGLVGDLGSLPVRSSSIGTVLTRSVLEHLKEPERFFAEAARVLVPGGTVVALAPNFFDYASIASRLTPQAFHDWFVPRLVENHEEVFPAYYRANTRSRVRRLAASAGLEVVDMKTFCQYPIYLMFSSTLFRIAVAYEKWISRHESLAGLRGWLLAVLRKPEAHG